MAKVFTCRQTDLQGALTQWLGTTDDIDIWHMTQSESGHEDGHVYVTLTVIYRSDSEPAQPAREASDELPLCRCGTTAGAVADEGAGE